MSDCHRHKLVRAAHVVLVDCLQRVEPIVLVCDKHGLPLADAFLEAAQGSLLHGLKVCYVSREHQLWCVEKKTLPQALQNELSNSMTLVTALTADENCTWFRAKLVHVAEAKDMRILHMPGVDEDLLIKAALNVDFQAIQEKGSPIHHALEIGNAIDIYTAATSGAKHVLRADISSRLPHLCGGIALKREIMNLPTGEVYIAPVENRTNGQLVLNGTTGERVLKRNDEVLLSFHNGQLDLGSSSFSDTAIAQGFKQELEVLQKSDPHNTILCEIGIGLNSTISSLRGNEVWDEKAFGTAHIALGSNKAFGGNIEVNFHRDLVFYPEAIRVDDHELFVQWRQPNGAKTSRIR